MRQIFAAGLVVISIAVALAAPAGEPTERPPLLVRDAASGCPGVSGAFVALLDPARGMLLLSGTDFPGGQRGPVPAGGPLQAGSWSVDEISVPSGAGPLWWARYPFLAEPGRGCVAFDRDRFSAEGDLVSYLRWVVEKVYLRLPEEERARFPAFALSERHVALRVEQEGFTPLRLEGREGSTLAFRVAGGEASCFLQPVVLDPGTGRLAIRAALTGPEAFAPKESDWRAFVAAEPGDRLVLPDVPARVVVEGLAPR